MSISSLKREFPLPEREFILNKKLTIKQNPAIVASVTEQAGIIKVWIFQQVKNLLNPNENDSTSPITNRDKIFSRTAQTRSPFGFISEIDIQGTKLCVSSQSSDLFGDNPRSYLKLQHFIEAGVDFSSVENANLDELFLTECQMRGGTTFPEIDISKEISASLTIKGDTCEILTEPSHYYKLKVGEQNIKASFTDFFKSKEIEYYINELVCYDIREETARQFENEKTLKLWKEHGLSDSDIANMKAESPKSFDKICPLGHVLLILNYECTDDIQLNFYTTEFLLEKINNDTNEASAFCVISSDEKGKHGFQNHSCLLKTVPIGYDDTIEIEFVSWYKKTSDEFIIC